MPLDAEQLGFERTMQQIAQLLAERFGVEIGPAAVAADQSLFAIGLGLSSLDGIEFLCEVEKKFGVRIDDLEWWVYESPTLANVARHVIELTRKQQVFRPRS